MYLKRTIKSYVIRIKLVYHCHGHYLCSCDECKCLSFTHLQMELFVQLKITLVELIWIYYDFACKILTLFMQFVKISHVAASIVSLSDPYQAIDFAQKTRNKCRPFSAGVFGTWLWGGAHVWPHWVWFGWVYINCQQTFSKTKPTNYALTAGAIKSSREFRGKWQNKMQIEHMKNMSCDLFSFWCPLLVLYLSL